MFHITNEGLNQVVIFEEKVIWKLPMTAFTDSFKGKICTVSYEKQRTKLLSTYMIYSRHKNTDIDTTNEQVFLEQRVKCGIIIGANINHSV